MVAASSKISLDISFGFDNAKYSDRTLTLEITDNDENRSPNSNGKRRCLDHTAPRLETVHICSLILAARSPFFRKLLSNDMRESEQKNVTLAIQTSEEAPLMDLLKYIYTNTLPTTLHALLDLLVIADKFDVASCVRHCSVSLQNLPMTRDLALHYLGLPSNLLMCPVVEPFIDAAKQFFVATFKDFDKFKEELLNLPLLGIQAILSSDDLQVTSENVVYDFVLTWANKHYPDLKERRGVLKTHLLHLVRFPFMTTTKLTEEAKTCSDIDPEMACKVVIPALCFKVDASNRKRCLAAEEGRTASQQFVSRAYKLRPIKVEFPLPHQCIIYLDLTREEVTHILNGGEKRSDSFQFGGMTLALVTRSWIRNQPMFRVGLNVVAAGSAGRTINYEIALRRKPSEKFDWVKHGYMSCELAGSIQMFHGLECSELAGDDSRYLINGVLYVRVMLS